MAATYVDLYDLPCDLSEHYLPYQPTLRQRQKAYAFSNNRYVHQVKLSKDPNAGDFHIYAKVYRSQRKSEKPHSVSMSINECTKSLTEGHCTCKAGITGECAHILATIMTIRNWILEGYREVPSEQSCTSLPQMWDKPRGPKIQPEAVTQMVISKPFNLNRKRKPLMATFHDNRKFKVERLDISPLQRLSGCAISYLVQHHQHSNKDIDTAYGPQFPGSGLTYHAPLIKPVELPEETNNPCGDLCFPALSDTRVPDIIKGNEHVWSNLTCSMEETRQIESNTRNQADSKLWMTERRKRITASNFGKFIKRKSAITDKFLKSVFQSQSFISKATTYGKANEKTAKQIYMKRTKNHVHEIGLVVNPVFPFLGATPDGKVCSNGKSGILEIKCPYSIRDLTFQEALDNEQHQGRLFLKLQDNKIQLDVNHEFYYQVQGQLLITGAAFCDFVAYTKKDLLIQRIEPDSTTFDLLLEKLASVYIQDVKPFLDSLSDC